MLLKMMLLHLFCFHFSAQKAKQTDKKGTQARSLPSDGFSASTLSGKHMHVQPTKAEELHDTAQRSQVVAAQKSKASKCCNLTASLQPPENALYFMFESEIIKIH